MTGTKPTERLPTAFLFDLDGTLVDSVYHHVLAWNTALRETGLPLSVWRIHRRIGMSGGLFANALQRDLGREIDPTVIVELRKRHAVAFNAISHTIEPLPGAVELLRTLTDYGVKWAIATSGRMETARPNIERLGVDFDKVPVVTRDMVRYAKPDPDLFLTAAERLGVDIENCMVVGDSIWDLLAARRARALGIGLLSGGYGEDELDRSAAYRVYDDPADLLRHLDEVGVRRPV